MTKSHDPQGVISEGSQELDSEMLGRQPRDAHDQVWTHGYNSCLHVAISALNYLSSHPRPIGGQSAYNAEHLLQIADDIKRTIAHNVAVVSAVGERK